MTTLAPLDVAPDVDRDRMRACEHEAAHAIVAHVLGLDVGTVALAVGLDGYTEYRGADRRQAATVAVAASVWLAQLRWRTYPEGEPASAGAGDRRVLHANADAFAAEEARKVALRILREHGDDVTRLAGELYRRGVVNFREWRTGSATVTRADRADVDRAAVARRAAHVAQPRRTGPDPVGRALREVDEFFGSGWQGRVA